jgi:2-iminobutanoate/2-iminopropanoate deaminase
MKLTKQAVSPPDTNSPGAFPYSPAIVAGDHIYVSGQGPIDPATGQIQGDSIEEQVELTLNNVQRILHAANATTDDAVKVTAYLSDLNHFDRYNAVYRRFFAEPRPARTTVEAKLWGGILVEIDVIAVRNSSRKG